MDHAFLCRYANQDIYKLRNVTHLTSDEHLVLALCTAEWVRREVEPLSTHETVTIEDLPPP